jgi:ATP-binding cassette subfamily B protein
LLKLLKGLKPYLFFVIINLFFVAIQAISELFLPSYTSKLIDEGLPNSDMPKILYYGGLMFVFTIISVGGAVIASNFASKISTLLCRDIRKKLFVKVNSFSLNEFDKISTSSLITRSTNDITQVQNGVFMILKVLTMVPITFIGSIIMTYRIQAKLTLILLVSIPIILILVLFVAKIIIPLFNLIQKKVDNLTLVAREGLTGVRVVRAFDQQENETLKFNKANKEVTDLAVKSGRIMSIMIPIIMLIMNLTIVAVYWFGAKRIQTINNINEFSVGDLYSVTLYVTLILFSVIMFVMMFIQIPKASASAKRINEVLAIETSITDSNAKTITNTIESDYGIEFNDVSFNFGGETSLNALDHISFKAKKGKTTAIVGSTGSGKTTLLNMIARFYDPTSGEILVSGQNIKDYTLKDLRQKLGFVPQKAFLFSGSIADNIRYGKEDATDEEILSALDTAQASEFLNEKEDGINSNVSQGGANFSGGQKQRLAIARAIVRNADVYLFDDSFSALDFKTDSKLRNALTNRFKSSTMLIIAQRISTVMNADKIIVLNEGKLVGEGTHKELLKSCTVYREIAESQLEEEELQA